MEALQSMQSIEIILSSIENLISNEKWNTIQRFIWAFIIGWFLIKAGKMLLDKYQKDVPYKAYKDLIDLFKKKEND